MASPETSTPRLRRTKSVNTAEQITHEAKKERAKQPDKPCHCPSDSLLSSSSGYNNYRGFLNLCIVLLALSNGRVALENIIKYGILVDPVQSIRIMFSEPLHWPLISLAIGSNIFIAICYEVEKKLSKDEIPEKLALIIHIINLATILIFPPVVVFLKDLHPVGASLTLGIYSVIFLKLISYIAVNRWCRIAKTNPNGRVRTHSITEPIVANGKIENSLVTYPDNIYIKDLYYFLLAPTLSYELNFPRSSRIRKRFVLNRVLEMIFLSQLIIGLIQQWMVPTIRNSMTPFKDLDYSRMLERLLKLAIPNHFIWLVFFYWYFHSTLNFMGEILRFADRSFYKDWWNAETVHYFWQNWNIPVHRWCLRHLYLPMLKKGFPKQIAAIVVFLVSAFFHEYLVSVPLKMFRVWAFMGMIAQVPLAIFVEKRLHGKFANMAVWLSLIIGQPLAILMYYHDYYILHYETQA